MSEKILYLECTSGISGDMTVAALLDLGASEARMREALAALPVGGYRIRIGRTKKNGIGACDFDVILEEAAPGQDHAHAHESAHTHDHDHTHTHTHTHEDGHAHTHEHRSYADIRRMLEEAPLPADVRALAQKIFLLVAQAESRVHETPLSDVHFHEVGAVDSIVDIVAAAACFADLGVTDVCVSPLSEGTGTTWCQHGRIPVPAPAVVEIVSAAGMPLKITDVVGEMVTPTGAAIAAALRTQDRLPERFVIEKIGIGAGKKDFPQANILRAMLIRRDAELPAAEETAEGDEITVLETNIDDCSGEQLAFAIERLMEAGARDASCFPICMKKKRPAWMLQVLCKEEAVPAMEAVIFRETTSIGLRKYRERRSILPRKAETIRTELGDADIKVCVHKGQTFYYPEYDSIKRICRETGKSYREVYAYLSGEAAVRLAPGR